MRSTSSDAAAEEYWSLFNLMLQGMNFSTTKGDNHTEFSGSRHVVTPILRAFLMNMPEVSVGQFKMQLQIRNA